MLEWSFPPKAMTDTIFVLFGVDCACMVVDDVVPYGRKAVNLVCFCPSYNTPIQPTDFRRACAAQRSSGRSAGWTCKSIFTGLIGVVGQNRMDRMEVLRRQRRDLEERYYKVRALGAGTILQVLLKK